jgi:hypothetical protein
VAYTVTGIIQSIVFMFLIGNFTIHVHGQVYDDGVSPYIPLPGPSQTEMPNNSTNGTSSVLGQSQIPTQGNSTNETSLETTK